jgi:NAD(P)H-quinone oxidoreductase subunit 3
LGSGIWYVVGFIFAGVSFVFLTFGAAWLVSHRNRGDVHKGLPYESGIDTYGDTHGRFGLSFYIYALLFVAFDIEVIFIYLWAIVFRDLLLGGFVSMLIFVAILLLGLAYAWRKGVLTWRRTVRRKGWVRARPTIPRWAPTSPATAPARS